MRNIDDIIKFAKERGPKTISVACCQDEELIKNCQDVWHDYPSVENYYQSEKANDKDSFEQGNLKGEDAYYASLDDGEPFYAVGVKGKEPQYECNEHRHCEHDGAFHIERSVERGFFFFRHCLYNLGFTYCVSV